MTYLWIPALQIHVWTDNDILRRFQWGEHIHNIQWIARQWRIDIKWWQQRIWRHYYKLVTDTGLLVIVFYDLLNDAWYLQQLYD